MPFLTPPIDTPKKTQFYVLRSIAPHLGVSFTLQKMAQTFVKQNKKVLIFDTLLGLKNFPLVNKNQDKIPTVLAGILPLSELIVKEKGVDVITGCSNQNLTALTTYQQQYLKESLKQLATNYDIVLIDMPCQVSLPTWAELGENMWIVSADKEIICNTLAASQPNPHLILNLQKDMDTLNQVYAFIKILSPACQITIF